MRITKFLNIFICFIILFSLSVNAAPVADFSVISDSAILMDLSTNQILYSKNPEKTQYPAGLVKAIAALVMLEGNDIESFITVSEAAVASVSGTNVLGLVPGEVLSLKEALYGMLLQSSNDCAVAAAESISGSTQAFVSKMNEKVKSLDCSNTNITNVTGLFSQDNYTSAHDMALVIKAASENPSFNEIAGTKSFQLPITNKMQARSLYTRCPLLSSYEHIKTGICGYTDEGRYTMAVTASNGNLDLVAVVMNSPDEQTRDQDCKNLLNYGFENFQSITIAPQELQIPDSKLKGALGKIGIVSFKLDNPITILAPIEATYDTLQFDYPKKTYKKNEDKSGTLTVLYNGEKITELNLTGTAIKKVTFYSVIKTILIIILILIVLFVLLCAYYIYDAEQKKKKRRQEKMKRTLRIKKDI